MRTSPSVDERRLIALFGAPTDTGNLGVSALGESTIASIAYHQPDAALLVFDNDRGRRRARLGDFAYSLDGAWISRRLHRAESLWAMTASSRLGILPNRNVAALRSAAQVLDVSGGDSFTDLYGEKRWQLVLLPKLLALRLARPLVLLPQTYGPFSDRGRRRVARDVVSRAASAWSRDPDGFDDLKELLGSRFDERRHREGVDVAFALPSREPVLHDLQLGPLDFAEAATQVVGLNVSGLLMNDPAAAVDRFGLSIDYHAAVVEVARRLLDSVAQHLVLVPHVRGSSAESDDRACARLAAELGNPSRVSVLPAGLDAAETKWCIGQMDWFCGTRMHSTIAALSSGVPAAAIAYSQKTKGVFATAGMEHAVADARALSTGDVVDLMVEQARRAAQHRPALVDQSRILRDQARAQFAEILDTRSAARPESQG